MKKFALGFAVCITLISCLTWAAATQLDVDRLAGSLLVRIDGTPVRAGSGKAATVERSASGSFDSIVLRSAENLEVQIGPQLQIKVSGDDNLLDLIETRLEGGRLVIDSHGSYRTRTPITVQVQLPALKDFTLEGSADARIRGLDGGRFRVELDGSGSIDASGKVEELAVDLNGSGDILFAKLQAKSVEAELNGSGDIVVAVIDRLRAEINGSGDIRYHGNPAKLHSAVNGSGDIEPAD